jgi:hypothetical protein
MIAGYRTQFMLDYDTMYHITKVQEWPCWWRAFPMRCDLGGKQIMLRGYKWVKH